jgi:hypothetical protein
MQGLVFLLLAGVMLCYLGIFLSLPAPTSEVPGVPSALTGANVGHADPDHMPDGSYLRTPAEELQDSDVLPGTFSLLTMGELALAYFGASVGWLLMPNARRQRVMCCSDVDDRWWVSTVPEGPSPLGVFRL